jgi:hypothetical protein
MNSSIASIGFFIALVALLKLVIYFVSRNDNTYLEPEYEHDYR